MIKTIKLIDLIKYLVGLMIVILIAVYSTRFFINLNDNKNLFAFNIDFRNIFKSTICIARINEDNQRNKQITAMYTARSGVERILGAELPDIKEMDKNDQAEKTNMSNTKQEQQEEKNVEQEKEVARDTVEIKDSYTTKYKSVTVKNLTDIKLTENILKPDYNVKNKKDVIIFHTHTCESYTTTNENKYKASGNFRTTDMNYSVARVGKELEKELEKFKFNVVRSEEKHDYPAYSGSYTRSLKTVQELLKKNKEAEIVFDIHRDAVGSSSNYAPTVEINGEKVAQLMFVIGTNDGGGKHPNWKNNLKFAVMVQEKANEMYPGLFRAINLRSETFNQKVTNAASIIEVGATGNTLEEACASMKYLAKVLDAVVNEEN